MICFMCHFKKNLLFLVHLTLLRESYTGGEFIKH